MTVLKKLLIQLASPVLALSLLIVIASLLVLGVNPWVKPLGIKTSDFFKTWFFIVVIVILLINLFFCTIKQITGIIKRSDKSPHRLEEITDISGVCEDFSAEKITDLLRQHRFRCRAVSDNEIIGGKHRTGEWSSVIFHIGLILICVGAIIEAGFSFSGRINLQEGELFEDRPTAFKYTDFGPLYQPGEHRFAVFLHGIKPEYKQYGVFAGGDISILVDGLEVLRADVIKGKPLAYKLWNFHFENFGYYAETLFTYNNQQTPIKIGLSTFIHKESDEYKEALQLAGTPYHLTISFIPDLKSYRLEPQKISYKPDRPAIKLLVKKNENGKSKQIFDDIVPLGQTVFFDQRAAIKFADYSFWISLIAYLRTGLYVIYAGFAVSCLGLALLYLWVPQYVRVVIVSTDGCVKVRFGGYTLRYKQVFLQRQEKIKKEIVKLLSKEVLS